MLHILLIILKIIGMILLVVLGLILSILLAVLLVPVRYRGNVSFHGELKGKGRVTWFLHLLSIQVSYDKTPEVSVRIFGKRILSELHKKDEEDMEAEQEDDGNEGILSVQERAPEQENTVTSISELPRTQPQSLTERVWEEKTESVPPKKQPRRKRLFSRIRDKILSFINRIRCMCTAGQDLLKKAEKGYQQASEFLNREENKRTLRLLRRQLGKLLHHLAPTRLSGELTLGMEDPYAMGQLVSAAAILYPVIQDRIRFTPIFGESVIDGELSLRGRIRVGTLLWLAVRILLDGNFRKLLRKILNRGGHKDGR